MKAPAKLRIGIVGAGSIVRERHMPNLMRMPGVEIIAVCNSTYESSRRFCEELAPHATPMKYWADLVGLPELDIVWIGTHPNLHSSITISALEAGRHVFCQARMASNLQEAEEMLAAANKNPHLVTMLCPPPHGLRGDLEMRRQIASGRLGRIHHVRLQSFSSQYLDPESPPHWRQREELSGNNILTLGIYVEVLQRWLGPIDRVYAKAQTIYPLRQGYQIRIPDMLLVLCEFANGANGVLEFSGVAAHAPGDRLEIYGSQGTLTYNFATDEIDYGGRTDPALERISLTPESEGTWRVEEDFIAAVRSQGNLRPRPNFSDGVAYMRVVDAVAQSRQRNREVDCR